jgi:hypothetical protein
MKKKLAFDEIKPIQQRVSANTSDYTSHFAIGVELDENGFPETTFILSSAKPAELLGMCTHLMSLIKDIETKTLEKLKPKKKSLTLPDEDVEKMISQLPEGIAQKARDFKRRMDEAVAKGDTRELKKLRDEIKGMSNPFKNNDDNTGESSSEKFDINDFK